MSKESDIMNQLTTWQRIVMCTWGMNRRYKYFDYIYAGMAQRYAWKKAKESSKKQLKIKVEHESIKGKAWRNREFDKKIGA